MSSKREREYERRRYEKWQQRQAQRARAQAAPALDRRCGVVAALVLAIGVGAPSSLGDTTHARTRRPRHRPRRHRRRAAPTATRDGCPDPALAEGRTWTGDIVADAGRLGIELDGAAAPQAVANFVTLASEGYFDGTRATGSHRRHLRAAVRRPDRHRHRRPRLHLGPDRERPGRRRLPGRHDRHGAPVGGDGSSMGSQFFLVYEDSTIPSDSAGGYTVFGRVTSGLDVVQAIADAGTIEGTEAPVSDVIIEGVKTQ